MWKSPRVVEARTLATRILSFTSWLNFKPFLGSAQDGVDAVPNFRQITPTPTVPVSKINVFGHRSKSSSFSKGWMRKSPAKHRMWRLIGKHAYDDDIPKTTLDESMTFAQNLSLWGSCSYTMFALCFNGGTCWAPETHGHDPWHTTMSRSTRRLQDKLKECGEFGVRVL